jgi:serine/threonine-protein kinase
MELVEGQPLSALLRPGSPLDPDVARDLVAQAADALGAAHARGIVHRDVKPANLIVTPDRRVKVTDFGIARAAEGMALTETGQVLGTPAYISPEQAEGSTATPASDVYALGVVAFECLAGAKPFSADTPVAMAIAHLRNPVPPLPGSVPADLAAVVRRALAKSPDERFADGSAFAAALRDPASAMGGAPATVPPSATVADAPATTQVLPVTPVGGAPATDPAGGTVAQPPPERSRRTGPGVPWPLVLGIVAVALAVVLAVWLGSRGDEPAEDTPRTPSPTQSPQSPRDTSTETPSPTPTETPSETTQTPTETPTETAATVEVDPASYVGRDRKDVEKELRDLGLRPEGSELENPGDQPPDVVVDVTPSGTLEEGDTVTISYYGKPPKPEKPAKPQGKGNQG